MSTAPQVATGVSLNLYRGDAKTLLAFNLSKPQTKNLAGFTIQCQPPGKDPYYIFNELQFADPSKHAQVPQEPPNSSVNAPIHMFRWTHVPGSVHQGLKPAWGNYVYTVTPRYFDADGSLLPLDKNLSVSKPIEVAPFESGNVVLGFTRGYTQSQAFVHHFGRNALIRPKGKDLLFSTAQVSGSNGEGQQYTYAEEYEWLGYTARERILALLQEVMNNPRCKLAVFAYDLNEPDVCTVLLQLAAQGRIRMILDNAALHKSAKTKTGQLKPAFEDAFEKLFRQKMKGAAAILRGHFDRYAHDKVFIVSDDQGPAKVLTGSTNFSVTGLYVNSNHILTFDDRRIAAKYQEVFDTAWSDQVKAPAFRDSDLAKSSGFDFNTDTGMLHVTFSPHDEDDATTILKEVVARIQQEGQKSGGKGSVLFAVMELDSKGKKPNMVYSALSKLHNNQKIFSFGISDSSDGVCLYKPGKRTGVLVTGKPVGTQLPAPFNQVPNVGGVGHQIHHKFVVCGFNSDDAVVFCGSSNLAEGGEGANGDNLLAIHSREVATVFAIEALGLVDHFNFLDKYQRQSKSKMKAPIVSKQQAARSVQWYLGTDDKWAAKYYDPKDLKCADRELFGS